MKKTTVYGLIIALLVFWLMSFQNNLEPNYKLKLYYLVQLDSLIYLSEQFAEEVLTLDNERINNKYLEVRQKFKGSEFLLAHIDKSFYLKKLNGAPLPKLEANVPEKSVIAPTGLQIIDELMAASKSNANSIHSETLTWIGNLKQLKLMHARVQFSNDLVVHAIQNELLRIYTMGITGFDTPGTQLGITDAQSAIHQLLEYTQLLDFKLDAPFFKELKLNDKFLKENTDFAKFDRLTYYKSFWQPLYASLIDQYGGGDFITWNELENKPLAVNAKAKHLFGSDFLNLSAFLDFSETDFNQASIDLGEKLFFDPTLSQTGKMSCSTCHKPDLAFSDGLAKSLSNDGKTTLQRNSPGLNNVVFTKALFYDLRADHLSQQLEHVIFSDQEFNTTLLKILATLEESKYKEQFIKAFPAHNQNPINPYTFKTALASYVASLNGFNSAFDKFMRGETDKMSKDAKRGFNLFMGSANCATCHFPPLFSGLVPPYFDDSESEVLGVPSTKKYDMLDEDFGRYTMIRIKETVDFYKHSFKTQTIRNVSKTAPYMHNGVFDDLEEVLEFYNNGGGVGHGFDLQNQTLSSDSLGLSKKDIKGIISFMKLLD